MRVLWQQTMPMIDSFVMSKRMNRSVLFGLCYLNLNLMRAVPLDGFKLYVSNMMHLQETTAYPFRRSSSTTSEIT